MDTDIVAVVVPHVGSASFLDPGNHVGARRIIRLAILTASPPEVRDVLVLRPTREADGDYVD